MPVNRAKFHFDNTYAGMDMLYGPYVLYQIGDLSCEAGYQTFEHEQAVYEITYVLSGTGAFYVDDTVYTMQKGDLLLVRTTSSRRRSNRCVSFISALIL